MGVILKIALRNMRRRKLRYILTTITLVISVALFGGVMIVSDSFEAMMLDTIDEQMGTADILIRSANSTDGWFVPDEINSEIESVSHVESIAYRISGFDVFASATDSGSQVDNSTRIGIYGIDPQDPDERKLGAKPFILDSVSSEDTIEGLLEYVDLINGDKVAVISESLKIQLGKDFAANDSIWIFPKDGKLLGYNPLDTGTWLEYTVVAIIRDIGEARDFDPENPSDSSMFSQGPGIFININNSHQLVDGLENHTGEYNLGVVGVDDIYKVSSVAKNIETRLEELNDNRDWRVNDLKSDSLEMIETTMSTLRTMFMMFGLIALILSIILMWNIFNIIKKEQEYETGMFQAIGASKTETFKMFLTQGAVMGVIGSFFGTICSYFISYVIFSVTLQTIQDIVAEIGGFPISDFTIVLYPTTLGLTFIVGLVSCIIASLYPSWKASRKPIIENLNPLEEKSKREKKHYWKRLIFFILGILLIVSGFWLMHSGYESSTEVQTGAGPPEGVVLTMFAPVLILFGIIWLLALSIKPLNKVFVMAFYPYLRKTRLLTEKNILRHRKRTTLTYTMIALTTSFLIGISVVMDSMKTGVNTTVNNFMGADIRVYTYGTPRSFESGLLNQSGVEDVMGVSHQNALVHINGEWVGHNLLDIEFNQSIMMNIIDPAKIKEHMTKTEIISPSSMSLSEMMDEIENKNNIIIDKKFADDYDVKVGQNVSVKFSLGITYANLSALLNGITYNAHEDTLVINMSVVAIVSSIQGFTTLDLLGALMEGKLYNMFISWGTYEEIASKNLPGGGTDMVLRQLTQTGNPMLDIVQSNWFNFSTVEAILNSISGIEYYTTRMDYYTPIFDGLGVDFQTPVVGIHTESSGNLKSDSYFGNNSLLEQKVGYNGTTMEELLNTTENVCIVDETFIESHPSLGIGDNISIFPQQFISETIPVGIFPYNATITPYPNNYTSTSGSTTDLYLSDDSYVSIVSNHEWLTFNITTSFLTPNIYKVINVTIETSLNSSVDHLDLEALNTYTNVFEKLGSINNTEETNNTFIFNLNHYYVDSTNNIKLRIWGHNSTYNGNYNLTIDSLKFGVDISTYSPTNPLAPLAWPKFEIIGIIEAPTLYNAERYDWVAGFETGYDSSGNSTYINYEKARDIIYSDYRGSNYSSDKVTSVLVHCDQPENIETIKNLLLPNLFFMAEGSWSVIDLKSFTLVIRTNVYDWFAWVEKGASDEDVLEEVLAYIEDKGYLVIFGFTKSFASSIFRTMLNLIVFITNGLLIFSIIIAMIGLTLHSLLTTMARRREIGMLRSIGLSKKGVIRSISGETLILALLGVFTGIFAGLVQGYLMVDTMPSGGLITVTWTIPWLTIGILILTVLITVILSSRYPAKWAANLNIIDAVRTR